MAEQATNTAVLEKIREKVEILKKQGGFGILKGVIDGKKGIREIDPKDEARRAAFLTDEDKAEKRKKLKAELNILKELVMADDPVSLCKAQNEKVSTVLNENLKTVFDNIKDLEKSYRTMDLFFRNAGAQSIRNLFVMNIPSAEFASDSNTELRSSLEEHFKENFDRFSLEDNYSLLVIPGYLGDNLDYWSKEAAKYRITLVTDFSDEREFESIQDNIEEKKLAGSDKHKANTVVTCNHIVVRKKHDGIENEDLVIPASALLAAKMWASNGIQPPAGKKHGKLDGALGVRMPLLRSQADAIDKMGLIPIIFEKEWGAPTAMSDTTLASESGDPDLRALGVVRAKDWIAKVLLDYFNGLTFQVFDGNLRKEIKGELDKFFKKISGYGGLIESYNIGQIDADPDDPQSVKLSVNVKPYFATKHYVIDFSGTQNRFEAEDNE